MTSLRQSLASKQASKQASRKSALWGEYNKTLTHCCIGFNLCGGAILLL